MISIRVRVGIGWTVATGTGSTLFVASAVVSVRHLFQERNWLIHADRQAGMHAC